MTLGIQLCDGGTKVQLCDGGTKVQLCEQVEPVPQECPPDLEDEYDVTVCGHTFTVTREVGSDVCTWTWTGNVSGCSFNIEYVILGLFDADSDGNLDWGIQVESTPPADYCLYIKKIDGTPKGNYSLLDSDGTAVCDATALVEETAP